MSVKKKNSNIIICMVQYAEVFHIFHNGEGFSYMTTITFSSSFDPPLSIPLAIAREIPNRHANCFFFTVIYHVCHVQIDRLHIDTLYLINASLQSRLLRFKCFPLWYFKYFFVSLQLVYKSLVPVRVACTKCNWSKIAH